MGLMLACGRARRRTEGTGIGALVEEEEEEEEEAVIAEAVSWPNPCQE